MENNTRSAFSSRCSAAADQKCGIVSRITRTNSVCREPLLLDSQTTMTVVWVVAHQSSNLKSVSLEEFEHLLATDTRSTSWLLACSDWAGSLTLPVACGTGADRATRIPRGPRPDRK